ncbi:hypothetical protein ABGA94_07685, partial [Stenotrophomonas sp. 3diitr2024]
DEEIIRASRRRNDTLPMGTTVVAARVQGNRYEVAWVGDSRAYLWRDEGFWLLPPVMLLALLAFRRRALLAAVLAVGLVPWMNHAQAQAP